MTQFDNQTKKIMEMRAAFLDLDDVAQEHVLSVLRALKFAQTTYTISSHPDEKKSKCN